MLSNQRKKAEGLGFRNVVEQIQGLLAFYQSYFKWMKSNITKMNKKRKQQTELVPSAEWIVFVRSTMYSKWNSSIAQHHQVHFHRNPRNITALRQSWLLLRWWSRNLYSTVSRNRQLPQTFILLTRQGICKSHNRMKICQCLSSLNVKIHLFIQIQWSIIRSYLLNIHRWQYKIHKTSLIPTLINWWYSKENNSKLWWDSSISLHESFTNAFLLDESSWSNLTKSG